jgi:hypothetical protein
MEVSMMTLADYVNGYNNTLVIVNVWTQLGFKQFPAPPTFGWLLVQIQANQEDFGKQYRLLASLVADHLTEPLFQIPLNLTVLATTTGLPAFIHTIQSVQNLVFPAQGVYQLQVTWGEFLLGHKSFNVALSTNSER